MEGRGKRCCASAIACITWIPIRVRQEIEEDNEVRILECRALAHRTAGTRLNITRRLHVG